VAENTLQTAQSFIQDVLAPDVRELKVKVGAIDKQIDSLEKHIDERFASFEKHNDERFASFEKRIDERFASFEKRMDERFAAERAHNDANVQMILAAIERLALVSENSGLRAVADLRERVAVLEARAA
jgi:hypothetical protein